MEVKIAGKDWLVPGGPLAKARVKRTESSASLSMFGVRFPLAMRPKASALKQSIVMRKMYFGLFCISILCRYLLSLKEKLLFLQVEWNAVATAIDVAFRRSRIFVLALALILLLL